jgi:Flp pilus assembly protein TadG
MAARDDTGQSLIEISLAFPMLLLLLLGATEVGRLAYYSIAVCSAAQAGVLYGEQSQITASDNAGIIQAATADGANVSGLTATPSHSCYCMTTGAQTAATHCLLSDCTSGQRFVEYVQVNTSATVTPMLNYPGVPSTFSLTGQANARVSQ